MSAIYVKKQGYVEYFNPGDLPVVSHRLGRRMSLLQKATLGLSQHLALDQDGFFKKSRRAIIFVSRFGEITINQRLNQQIAMGDRPISPKSFGQSTANAALGYLTMVHQSNLPAIVLDGGFLGFDKALYWALCQIRAGIYQEVLVMKVDEYPDPQKSEAIARAIGLVLTTNHPVPGSDCWSLEDMTTGRSPLSAETDQIATQVYREIQDGRQSLPKVVEGAGTVDCHRGAGACQQGYLASLSRVPFELPTIAAADHIDLGGDVCFRRVCLASSGEWWQSIWMRKGSPL